jgi:hypothetical protein
MAVEITITDDGTRRALRFAIWDRLHNALGDGTGEFYDLSRAALVADDTDEDTDEIGAVEMVLAAADAAEQISVAELGEKVMLSIPLDALMDGLDMCLTCLREDRSFWDAAPMRVVFVRRPSTRRRACCGS